MNNFINTLAAMNNNHDFDDNFNNALKGSFKLAYIIGAIMAVVFVAVVITIIVLVVKHRKHIAEAGKGMAGAIKETFDSAAGAISKAAGKDSYSTCQYCGSTVKSSQTKCPHCGASVTHKSK